MPVKSIRTWIFFAYGLVILLLSSIPASEFPKSSFWVFLSQNDKFVHFTEYAIFGFLLLNVLKLDRIKGKQIAILIFILLFFPIADELLQSFIPRRIPDIQDGIADVVGGFVGVVIRSFWK
ncbi:MAG: VanZ family protein [Candidatus Marinimicrobia bacterium]|nr:VanZ family protein [Candidatus Neomarinimicrobiota bacterium]MBL7023209.1 VanZ family protein [Candidatus Neomarinimicrobiota bacterium]MBL7109982.1 VanZ family protein [Candidatus Neomarinimicrobiota bacterium]